MRIGVGFDVHQLSTGKKLFIGGIEIEHSKGAVGHSDADVMIHAVCDALLGAANLGDIGSHFPDTSSEFKDVDSKILLKEVCRLLREASYEIGNIDITLCLQKPKIAPYISAMKQTMATVMGIDILDLSVKATTTEMMGYVGREEGISCYAVALIKKAE